EAALRADLEVPGELLVVEDLAAVVALDPQPLRHLARAPLPGLLGRSVLLEPHGKGGNPNKNRAPPPGRGRPKRLGGRRLGLQRAGRQHGAAELEPRAAARKRGAERPLEVLGREDARPVALRDRAAVLEEEDARREVGRERDLVRHEDDGGAALPVDPPQRLQELEAVARGEPGGGAVAQATRRPPCKGTGGQ